jgi:hypothetical protein
VALLPVRFAIRVMELAHDPAVVEPQHQGGIAVGLFSKDIKSLEDLFKHGLEDLYYAEN